MRLALVRQDFVAEGAIERITESALEALLERNVAVSLYTRAWPQTRLQLVEPVICNPFHVGALWRDWGFARATCRDIRRAQPSLVESHERMLCCDVYRAVDGVEAVWQEERLKRASPRDRISAALSLRNRYRLGIERQLYASPWLRAVICNSKMVRDEISSRFGVHQSKLHVVYNSVDSDVFNPGLRRDRRKVAERHRIDPDAVVFALVATDFDRCDTDTAIEAIAKRPARVHLLIVGADPDRRRLRKRARALGIGDRVTFAGASDDPRAYYGAADVCVLPSIYDPSPTIALQAMACGLPVVTSTKSGAAELLREHEAGLVFASGDVGALAAHIAQLQDATMRVRLGGNARRVAQLLSPSAITLQLVLLYRDLLASMSKPHSE